ncbi:MAG: ACP phosphodiesterase [Chitinophagaceae bacterium]
MNYLAHAYLSFNQPGLLVGNMISDFVKGKRQYDYPDYILKGIKLHRAIDTFTDEHAITRRAKEYFRKDYRLYSGAFVDVVYDHFLATDKKCFATEAALQATANFTYETLEQHFDLLPAPFQPMLPYMKTQNWLLNYKYHWGIENSLAGVVRRSKFLEESSTAFALFLEHYDGLKTCYEAFFPELKTMAQIYIGV